MLHVLLVKIQPTDRRTPEDFKYFGDETLDFKIPVLNGDPLQFQFSKEFYFAPNTHLRYKPTTFYEKAAEINNELGVNYGGHVVAIDKYPYCQFENGVKIDEEQKSANSSYVIARYEIECQSEDFDYNAIILLIPGREPTVLSTLKFACSDGQGFCSSSIVFKKKAVLSVKSPFGEVIGINLEHCSNESALQPDRSDLCYAMSFEKVSLSAVVLQKLLQIESQADILSNTPEKE